MLERSPLGVIVETVRAAADYEFALVRLADVAVDGVRHHHDVQAGLDGLGDERLQCDGFDRQPESRQLGKHARMPRDDDGELPARD